jgi:hypothetical protein
MKVLKAPLNLVSTEYSSNAKSVEALTAKQTVLNQQADVQKQKVATLQSALQKATAEYGEGSAEANKYEAALYDAQATLGKMESELRDCTSELDKASSGMAMPRARRKTSYKAVDDAGDAADKSGKKYEKFASVMGTVCKALGAAVAAAAAAAVGLAKAVVNAYADYEQLVGGVDTLFKQSSGKLQAYAADAYKTAGLSANDYMSTVTAFSASLISSWAAIPKRLSIMRIWQSPICLIMQIRWAAIWLPSRMLIRVLPKGRITCSTTSSWGMAVRSPRWSVCSKTRRKSRVSNTTSVPTPMLFRQSTSCKRAWVSPGRRLWKPRRPFPAPSAL